MAYDAKERMSHAIKSKIDFKKIFGNKLLSRYKTVSDFAQQVGAEEVERILADIDVWKKNWGKSGFGVAHFKQADHWVKGLQSWKKTNKG